MSARRRRSGGRNRRMWLPIGLPSLRADADLEDMPLSVLALLQAQTTSRKKTPQRRRKNAPRATPPAQTTSVETINLDESVESAGIVAKVNSKIDTFLETASFISSDEEEAEMIKAKTNKKPVPNQFFISDDSDDDIQLVNVAKKICTAGTSTSTATSNEAKVEASEDDIMHLIDTVLDNSSQVNQTGANQEKSLEEYRKETEEMLKKASSLLDEFKTGRKPEPEVQKVESPKVTVGSCPICLESLSDRPAAATVCGHIFCKECITQTAKAMKKCPTCRKAITVKKIHPIYF